MARMRGASENELGPRVNDIEPRESKVAERDAH